MSRPWSSCTVASLSFAQNPEHSEFLIVTHLARITQHAATVAQRLAGGHLTFPPKASVYSSVASLCSIRIVAFLSELNALQLSAANVGNAYLETQPKELIVFKAGPEFGPLQGHTLAIRKALYGRGM